MTGWGGAVTSALRYRRTRRAGRDPATRAWRPWHAWVAAAAGLAAGPWVHGEWRAAAILAVLAAGATRPARRDAVLWVLAATALLVGGLRADAIDRAVDAPLAATAPAAGGWWTLTLREPLAAGEQGQSRSALATLDGRAIILATPRFGAPTPAIGRGLVVEVQGALVPLAHERGDARLRRLGVGHRLRSTALRPTQDRRGGVAGAIDRFGERAQAQLQAATGQRRGALLAGMALGIEDGIAEADQEALRAAGLAHLVAASGGNIALVIALVMVAGWLAGIPDLGRIGLSALAVALYVPLAGGGPSIQRAGVMGLAALLALALGRERRAVDALALAAAATLLVDPRATLDVGWQLSFAAAGALIAGTSSLSRRMVGVGVPRPLAIAAACSGLATLATAPITLVAFGELSLIGLLANLLVMPLVGIAVWSGALAAVLTPLAPAAAGIVAQPGGVAAGLTLDLATWAERRTFAVVGPEGAMAALAALALVRVVSPPRWVVGALTIAGALALAFSVPRPPAGPRLLVIDIGQGSAALLQDGPDAVLVDAGPADGGVVRAIRRAGVRRLHAVILSHPAADHDGGAAAAIAAFPTDMVLDGGDPGGGPTHAAAMRAAAARGTPVVPVRAGQELAFGAVSMRVRWPTPAAARADGDPNDRAAVVEARLGGLRALLPADAEGNVLTALGGLRADVLVVSHHGSNDDALPGLLRRLRPKAAVISLGTPNTYGHPTPATLGALRTAGVPTLRTDQGGSVDIRPARGGSMEIRRVAAEPR